MKTFKKTVIDRRTKRHRHIRKKISGTKQRPRLTVYRSGKHIFAQIVNDEEGKPILGVGSHARELSEKKPDESGKIAVSYQVGQRLAELALKKGIKTVIFDRSGYLYHGRVRALAEGAREGGLEF